MTIELHKPFVLGGGILVMALILDGSTLIPLELTICP